MSGLGNRADAGADGLIGTKRHHKHKGALRVLKVAEEVRVDGSLSPLDSPFQTSHKVKAGLEESASLLEA